MSRAEQAANAIKDAMEAYRLAGVLPSPEEIKSMAITFLIEENKFGRIPQRAEAPVQTPVSAVPAPAPTQAPAPEKSEVKVPVKSVPMEKPQAPLQEQKPNPPSPAQVKYLFSVANDVGFRVKDWLGKLNVSSPFQLSSKEISLQIDNLKRQAG